MTFRGLLGQSIDTLLADGRAVEVARDLRWSEGPVWWPARGIWVFSDIPNDRMLQYDTGGGLATFRAPSSFANGNSVARDGSLLTCEHLARRVTRTLADGTIGIVCDRFGDARLNSPNDVVEAADGAIWFTDPTYGILSDLEGRKAPSEQACNRVYRVDPVTGEASGQVEHLRMPNGLCFSPDGRWLYVADSGAEMGPDVAFDPDGPRDVWRYPVAGGVVAGEGAIFRRVGEGVPDGMRCDEDGYLWIATGSGLECCSADGRLVGVLPTPEVAANLAFGGADGRELMICTASRVYIVEAGRSDPASG